MPELRVPSSPPMGRLDAIDIAGKKLTIQTEFFTKPEWRLETKVYLGGALKKVYATPLADVADADLQVRLNEIHQQKFDEIVAGLRGLKK